MNYWLLKSEPDVFGIHHLKTRAKQTEHWDGVRNYQARNFLRDQMQVGDQAFFYHSSCAQPAIVGIVKIVRAGYPDPSAFDPTNPHYDAKSTPANPTWYMVDVRMLQEFKQPISLQQLKRQKSLAQMKLLQRGNRLSVMPVTKKEWDSILKLATTVGRIPEL